MGKIRWFFRMCGYLVIIAIGFVLVTLVGIFVIAEQEMQRQSSSW